VDEKSSFWDQLQKDIEKNMASDDNTAHPWLEDFNSLYNTPHKVNLNYKKNTLLKWCFTRSMSFQKKILC